MRLTVLILGLVLAACGGSSSKSPQVTAPQPTATVQASGEDAMIADLLTQLRADNAEHYAVGCLYRYDWTADANWKPGDILAGLPEHAATATAIGTETLSVPGWLTLYDSASSGTNATDFARIDGDRRSCFVPKQS